MMDSFYKNFTSTAPWVTLQNDNLTYGVGILYENGLLEYQGWQNRDMPFNNVRSLIQFPIPAYSQIHARAYLMLGYFDTINGLATNLLNILPPFGSLDTPAHNGSTTEGQLEIAGWALDNRGVASVQASLTNHIPIRSHTVRVGLMLVSLGLPIRIVQMLVSRVVLIFHARRLFRLCTSNRNHCYRCRWKRTNHS